MMCVRVGDRSQKVVVNIKKGKSLLKSHNYGYEYYAQA